MIKKLLWYAAFPFIVGFAALCSLVCSLVYGVSLWYVISKEVFLLAWGEIKRTVLTVYRNTLRSLQD